MTYLSVCTVCGFSVELCDKFWQKRKRGEQQRVVDAGATDPARGIDDTDDDTVSVTTDTAR